VVAVVLDGGLCWSCGGVQLGAAEEASMRSLCLLSSVHVEKVENKGVSQSNRTNVCQALYRSGVLVVVVCLV
jgi:hypothetical protein